MFIFIKKSKKRFGTVEFCQFDMNAIISVQTFTVYYHGYKATLYTCFVLVLCKKCVCVFFKTNFCKNC